MLLPALLTTSNACFTTHKIRRQHWDSMLNAKRHVPHEDGKDAIPKGNGHHRRSRSSIGTLTGPPGALPGGIESSMTLFGGNV